MAAAFERVARSYKSILIKEAGCFSLNKTV
jgi:hypothetical protein